MNWVKSLLVSRVSLLCGAIGAFVIANSLEANLARLHAPGGAAAPYRRLRWFGSPDSAFDTWEAGTSALQAFDVRSATWLIVAHVIADTAFCLLLLAWSRQMTTDDNWKLVLLSAVAADVAGNVVELINLWPRHTLLAGLAGVLWLLCVVFYVTAGIMFVIAYRGDIASIAKSSATLRLLLFADIALFVLIFIGRIGVQSDDLVERWFTDPIDDPLSGPMLYPLLCYAMFVCLVRSTRRFQLLDDGPIPDWAAVLTTAILLAAGIAFRFTLGWGWGMLSLAIGCTVVMLGSQGAPTALPGPAVELEQTWHRSLVAALPALALAIVLLRSGANSFAVSSSAISYVWLLGSGIGGVLVCTVAARCAAQPNDFLSGAQLRLAKAVLLVIDAAMLAMLLVIGGSPGLSRDLGAFGLLFLGMATAAAFGLTLRAWLSPRTTPLAFRRLGFARTPIILLLVCWILATSFLNGLANTSTRPISYYDARLTQRFIIAPVDDDTEGDCVAGVDPKVVSAAVLDHFCRWVDQFAVAEGDGTNVEPIPLVLVTASGGGVRAAAWTSTVLDCVLFRSDLAACEGEQAADRFPMLFAANGASGGSIGIVSTVAERLTTNRQRAVPSTWIDEGLGGDALAPTVGRAIAYDGLLGLLGINHGHDRTWTLESAWSEPWEQGSPYCVTPHSPNDDLSDLGLISLYQACPVPLMMFNGIDVSSGCRVNITPVDIDAGLTSDDNTTIDLVDNLDPRIDVPLFTAAFLSARFPLVSSAGRVDGTGVEGGQVLNIVDGGYGENSGTAQVAELWRQLRPLLRLFNEQYPLRPVKPVLVQIDNGEGNPSKAVEEIVTDPLPSPGCPTKPSTIGELLRPLEALAAVDKVRDQTLQRGLVRSVNAFSSDGAIDDAVVVTLKMYEHPGRTMPLGWTLSENTIDDLRDQLSVALNADALDTLERTLS